MHTVCSRAIWQTKYKSLRVGTISRLLDFLQSADGAQNSVRLRLTNCSINFNLSGKL